MYHVFAGFVHHASDPFSSKEKALMYVVIALFYMINGGGKYSGDSMIRQEVINLQIEL